MLLNVIICTFELVKQNIQITHPMSNLSNNDIMKKLRVALQLRNEDIVEICKLVEFKITISELGAMFRADDHPNFKPCGDQILRNFLNGLVIYKRGPMEKKPAVKE